MAKKHFLIQPFMMEALSELADPEKTACFPLVKGKAAGEMGLLHQIFPPDEGARDSIPAVFTFALKDGEHWRPFRVGLVVTLVDTTISQQTFVVGSFVSMQWANIANHTTTRDSMAVVGVRYDPLSRDGFIFLDRRLVEVLRSLDDEALEKVQYKLWAELPMA